MALIDTAGSFEEQLARLIGLGGAATGPSEQDKRQALSMGLMAAGAGLLGNRSQFLGPGLAAGTFHGMGAYQNALQQAQQDRAQQLQTGLLFKKMQDSAAQQRALSEAMAGLPADQQRAAMLNPEAFSKALAESMFKQAEDFTLTPGARRFGPGGQLIAESPVESKPSDLARLISEMNSLPAGDPRRSIYQQAIGKATTHAPAQTQITLGSPQIMTGPSGETVMVQPANRPGAAPQITTLTGLKPAPAGGQKMPGEIQRMTIAMDALDQGLGEYEKLLSEFDPRSPQQLMPETRARANALMGDLQMQMKEAQALGALTGPDVAILDKLLTDPASARGAFYGRKGLMRQAQEAKAALGRRRAALQKQYPDAPAVKGRPGEVQQQKVVRTGTHNGRKVEQLEDGSLRYVE